MNQIPVFKPFIEQAEIQAMTRALEIGWLGMGAFVDEFERKIQEFIQAKDSYVVAVSTGHAALHLGLLIAGVGPGDEVITPSFNNIADFQAILATGAEPVFCDIDQTTLCIDIEKAEKLVSPRTKALIAMDYDCLLCDHESIAKFAKTHRIRIIHDAAHSFGSKYKGKMVGSFSDICMFSFDPVKTITCIDGGILVVKAEKEKQMLHEMRLIGMSQPASLMYQNKRAWTYDVHRLGFRYHLSNPHAALGVAQLEKMDRIIQWRREACRFYSKNLREIPNVQVPETDFEDITAFLYYIRVPSEDRGPLREFLSKRSIDTGIHWQPGHRFSLLKNYRRGDLSVTERVAEEILSLPLHSNISKEDQNRVIDALSSYFLSKKRKTLHESTL